MPIWLLKIRKIIGKITDALVAGRAAGLWDRGNAPDLRISQPLTGVQNFSNPITAIKGKIKDEIVEAGLRNVQRKIDTPEERKVLISGIHIPGIPTQYAWVIALLTGFADMLLEVLSTSDPALLVSDWRQWAHLVLVALVAKILLWLRSDSHNGTAVINQSTVDKVAGK